MQVRIVRLALSALLISGAVAACGGGSSSSGNGVASKSANAIVSAASDAIGRASSVHVSGSVVSAGIPLTLNLSLVSGKGGQGQMAESGLSFRIVAIGQTLYIQGTKAFWRHFAGEAVAARLDGKWLKAAATGEFAPLAALTNMRQLFSSLLPSNGTAVKHGTSTVSGQKAVAVTYKGDGETVYVATTGQPYPLQISKGGASGGKIVFDRYNQSVSLSAPANATDISQLK